MPSQDIEGNPQTPGGFYYDGARPFKERARFYGTFILCELARQRPDDVAAIGHQQGGILRVVGVFQRLNSS